MATPELIRLAQRGALAMRMMGSDEERKTWINENMTEEDKDILVNDFGMWAKSINLDNAVKTNILPAEEGEKQVIQAFYKGTPMPMVFICTPEEWQKQLEEWNPIIVDGLRKGHTLKWQLSLYKAQMEKMEEFILKDCGGKGGNVGGASEGQRGVQGVRVLQRSKRNVGNPSSLVYECSYAFEVRCHQERPRFWLDDTSSGLCQETPRLPRTI